MTVPDSTDKKSKPFIRRSETQRFLFLVTLMSFKMDNDIAN